MPVREAESRPGVTHVLALAEKPGRLVWAGAERHLRVLLPALARRGVPVEALVLATDPGPVVERGLEEWRQAGVAVEVLARRSRGGRPANLPGFALQHLRLWAALRRRRDRIVHLHLDLFFATAAAILAGCRRLVFTLHNEEPRPRGALGRLLVSRWLHVVARRCARVIAISERAATHFRGLSGCPREEIAIIEYGIDRPPGTSATRRSLGWPEAGFVVGFLGRLAPEKNVPALLEAAARCPEVDFVLVGDGPLRREIERQLAERGLGNVRLAGRIEDGSAVIPLFDALCLPSHREGLGLVLVEAMLQGVPVIGSRAGAIPDVLGQGRFGRLFNPDDASALARAILEIRERPLEARVRAERARRYALERFSVERMAGRTVDVYAEAPAAAATARRPLAAAT